MIPSSVAVNTIYYTPKKKLQHTPQREGAKQTTDSENAVKLTSPGLFFLIQNATPDFFQRLQIQPLNTQYSMFFEQQKLRKLQLRCKSKKTGRNRLTLNRLDKMVMQKKLPDCPLIFSERQITVQSRTYV